MRTITIILICMLTYTYGSSQTQTIYDFKVKTLAGEDFDLARLKGKKVLIVNTASKCGNTPQYADLQKLYEKYGDKNFVIIGFPANDFMNQEPGSNDEIASFCKLNYGVTFPMMEKISVKGDDMHPLYQYLTQKSENGILDAPVTWNFQKFMIDERGKVAGYAKPKTSPMSDEIVSWIER